MNQRGKPSSGSNQELSHLYANPQNNSPIFPGKSTTPNPYNRQNLAVQRSLMEIFDEFTEVISGELKSMRLDDPDAHTLKSQRQKPS